MYFYSYKHGGERGKCVAWYAMTIFLQGLQRIMTYRTNTLWGGRDMTCNISLFVSIWYNSYCGVENCSILQRKGPAYIGVIVTRSTRGPAATTDDSRHVLWPPLSANPWKGSDVRNNGAVEYPWAIHYPKEINTHHIEPNIHSQTSCRKHVRLSINNAIATLATATACC